VYAGEMGKAIETRHKENVRHICLGHPEKSAVAEHWLKMGYNIEVSNTAILDKAPGYMDSFIKGAIEIMLHPRNFSRDGGFNLSRSWSSVTNMLKQYQDTPNQKQDQAKQTYNSTQ
jgi:hypothetical protein